MSNLKRGSLHLGRAWYTLSQVWATNGIELSMLLSLESLHVLNFLLSVNNFNLCRFVVLFDSKFVLRGVNCHPQQPSPIFVQENEKSLIGGWGDLPAHCRCSTAVVRTSRYVYKWNWKRRVVTLPYAVRTCVRKNLKFRDIKKHAPKKTGNGHRLTWLLRLSIGPSYCTFSTLYNPKCRQQLFLFLCFQLVYNLFTSWQQSCKNAWRNRAKIVARYNNSILSCIKYVLSLHVASDYFYEHYARSFTVCF